MMLDKSPLGKATVYKQTYSPELLCPIPRTLGRDKIGVASPLFFNGIDVWSGFELSWLNQRGKPEIAMAEFRFPCTTPFIVESKSFKLYLNSFNQSSFESFDAVREILEKDLGQAAGGNVDVCLIPPSGFRSWAPINDFSGINLDLLDIDTATYDLYPDFLTTTDLAVEETLYSHLLKSNCLATGQPDWGSVQVRYKGKKIDHEGLLKYIISFRNHSGFAEHCVERMFCDLTARCKPECLSVLVRYTRRGGLDINPFRSNFEELTFRGRQPRQ